MADYNLVKIGDVCLTNDGLETGMPCRTEVRGTAALKHVKTGIIRRAADGTPYRYSMPNEGKGLTVVIILPVTEDTVMDSVVAENNDAMNAQTTVRVVIQGDTGDFDLQCEVDMPNGIDFPGTFSNGRVDGVGFTYVISSINPPEEPEP